MGLECCVKSCRLEQKYAYSGSMLTHTLRSSEERFRLLVDGIAAQVSTLTPTGELEFVNREVLDYFGKSLEELQAWRSTDSIHPDDLPR